MKNRRPRKEKQKKQVENFSIPYLTDSEVLKLYETIKPIVIIDGVECYLNELDDIGLSETNLMRVPDDSKLEQVNMDDLKIVKDIRMIHKFNLPLMFRATVLEVISQIPRRLLSKVNAFEIIQYPQSREDVCADFNEFDEGFHVSKVRLYGLRKTTVNKS